jgi:hypothetical protein
MKENYLFELKKRNAFVVDYLKLGVNETTLSELLESLQFELPDSIKNIYKWQNGTEDIENKTIGESSFFPGYIFLSLEDAKSIYLDSMQFEGWDRKYFPVFSSGGGDFLLVNCDRSDLDFEKLFFYCPSDTHMMNGIASIYDNIDSFFKTIYQCLENGGVEVNKDDGFVDIKDYNIMLKISYQNNPLSEYWKGIDFD